MEVPEFDPAQSPKERVVRLMAAAGHFAESIRPEGQGGLGMGQELVVGLSAWAFGLYRGVWALIKADLPDEAQVLLRTLLEDAIRLAFLRLRRDHLDEYYLRFQLDAVKAERDLEAAGQARFPQVGSFPGDLQQEEAAIRARAAELGISRLKGFPTTADMITALDEPPLYWMFKLFSMSVHTSRLALGSKVMDEGPEIRKIGNWADIKTAVRVGHSASQALAAVTQASADVLGWGEPERVAATFQAIEPLWLQVMDDVGIPRLTVDGDDATA